jgi:thiamine biosynthesis lipoprotein
VEVREAYYVMGTVLEITVEAPGVDPGRRWIRAAAAEAVRLDRLLTSFDPGSALSRLNARAGFGFQRVPHDLFAVIARSEALSRATGGTFDVSVAPLVDLWRRSAEADRWPDGAEVSAARARTGFEHVRLHRPEAIALDLSGMAIDLGGVGKGYAADRIAGLLRRSGARAALVNFGESSLVAVGAPEGTDGWAVWIRGESAVEEGPMRLRDTAVSTSWSLGAERRVAGRTIGHIVDPRSGEPLRDARRAIVVAPSATDAEAWSKALVLAPEPMLARLAGREGSGGLVVVSGRRLVSGGFSRIAGWDGGGR